jgi:hypothetical protein
MQPFRDDLAAAVERVRVLEAENAELKQKLAAARSAPRRRRPTRIIPLLALAAAAVWTGGIAALTAAHAGRAHAPCPLRGSEGVVIVPRDRAVHSIDIDSPLIHGAPRKVAAPGDCRCTPGDPLCSCL